MCLVLYEEAVDVYVAAQGSYLVRLTWLTGALPLWLFFLVQHNLARFCLWSVFYGLGDAELHLKYVNLHSGSKWTSLLKKITSVFALLDFLVESSHIFRYVFVQVDQMHLNYKAVYGFEHFKSACVWERERHADKMKLSVLVSCWFVRLSN